MKFVINPKADPPEEYQFKFTQLMAVEMIAVKRVFPQFANKGAFWGGLIDEDPEAWQALVHLLRKRAGAEVGRMSDTDFPLGACEIVFDDEEKARFDELMAEMGDAEKAAEAAARKADAEDPPTVASPGTTSGSPGSDSIPGTTAEAPPS